MQQTKDLEKMKHHTTNK